MIGWKIGKMNENKNEKKPTYPTLSSPTCVEKCGNEQKI